MKKLLSVVAVILAVTAIVTLLAPSKPAFERLLQLEVKNRTLAQYVLGGCVSKGMTHPQLGMALVMSGGRACIQVVGSVVERELARKDSLCAPSDQKCLFAIGYAATTLALGANPTTKEELDALGTEIDLAYEKASQN